MLSILKNNAGTSSFSSMEIHSSEIKFMSLPPQKVGIIFNEKGPIPDISSLVNKHHDPIQPKAGAAWLPHSELKY